MQEVNISAPSEEWKNSLQSYAMELTNIRYRIDMGEYSLTNEYKAKLNAGVRTFYGWLTEAEEKEIKGLQESIRHMVGVRETTNDFTGNTSRSIGKDFSEYISKLDKIEQILRIVMKRENFLVKVSEKKIRLT